MRRIVIATEKIDTTMLTEAADAIRAGSVVAIPTDTLYGLAADPFRPEAVARLFEIKGRPPERAVALIAADRGQIEDRFGPLPPLARRLAGAFWPGPLTLLVAAVPGLAADVAGSTGKVGVRVPAHSVARRLCDACGTPLTATSANISGESASNDPDHVARALGDRVAILVDAGPTPGGPPSTVVDATGSAPVLVRAGAIAWADIQRVCG